MAGCEQPCAGKENGVCSVRAIRDEVLEENGEIRLEGHGYKEQLGVWQPSISEHWQGMSVLFLLVCVLQPLFPSSLASNMSIIHHIL